MIIKATRISTGSGAGAVAAHVLRGEKNERIELLQGSEAEMHAAARDAEAAGAKYALRHYKISPAEAMTSDDARAVLADLGREFGFDPDRATLIEHQKPRAGGQGFDRHWHAIVPELDPVSGRVLDSSWMRPRHEKVARMAEDRLGHTIVLGRFNASVGRTLAAEGRQDLADRIAPLAEQPRPTSAYRTTTHQRAARHGHDLPAVRLAVRAAWEQSDSAQAFAAALAEQGISIRPGEKAGIYIAEREGTLIGAVHRLVKEPLRDVAERLEAMPVPAPAAPPEPPAPHPPGGEPAPEASAPAASQDATPTAPAPQEQGEAMPAAAIAPAPSRPATGGGGGGGGAASPPAEAPAAPSQDGGGSDDPTAGIEPPKPGDLAGELRYREAVTKKAAEIAERKARARTPAPQDGRKGHARQGASGGGGDTREVQRRAAEAVTAFFAAIREGAEREQARRELAAALAALDEPDAHPGRDTAGKRADEDHRAELAAGSGAGRPGSEHVARAADPARERRAEPDSRAAGRDSDPGREPDEARKEAGRALAARALVARFEIAAAPADPTRMRGALAALADPTRDMNPRERRNAVAGWKDALLAEFRGERKDAGRERWAARMAEQRARSDPAAAILLSGRRLEPQEKADAWARIRDARERAKAELRDAPKPDFRAFLEVLAKTDPKARAVLDAEHAKDERKARIRTALDREAEAIAAIRATEPQGERDGRRAAMEARATLLAETMEREKTAREARERATAAARAVRVWHGPSHPRRLAAREAEALAEAQEYAAAMQHAGPSALQEAGERAERRAAENARAYAEWQRGPGAEADRRESTLESVRAALKGGDREIWRAMDRGGYAAAAREAERREVEERRRREDEMRREMAKNVIPLRQRTEQPGPGMAGPRMR